MFYPLNRESYNKDNETVIYEGTPNKKLAFLSECVSYSFWYLFIYLTFLSYAYWSHDVNSAPMDDPYLIMFTVLIVLILLYGLIMGILTLVNVFSVEFTITNKTVKLHSPYFTETVNIEDIDPDKVRVNRTFVGYMFGVGSLSIQTRPMGQKNKRSGLRLMYINDAYKLYRVVMGLINDDLPEDIFEGYVKPVVVDTRKYAQDLDGILLDAKTVHFDGKPKRMPFVIQSAFNSIIFICASMLMPAATSVMIAFKSQNISLYPIVCGCIELLMLVGYFIYVCLLPRAHRRIRYAITERGIYHVEGIFDPYLYFIPYSILTSVTLEYGIANRLAKSANIVIGYTLNDKHRSETHMRLYSLEDYQEVYDVLTKYYEEANRDANARERCE